MNFRYFSCRINEVNTCSNFSSVCMILKRTLLLVTLCDQGILFQGIHFQCALGSFGKKSLFHYFEHNFSTSTGVSINKNLLLFLLSLSLSFSLRTRRHLLSSPKWREKQINLRLHRLYGGDNRKHPFSSSLSICESWTIPFLVLIFFH